MKQAEIDQSYESLLARISKLEKASSEALRKLEWFDDNRFVGMSRDSKGTLEIFIAGSRLLCESPIVSANIEYSSWITDNDFSFDANKIKLSPESYFDSVAAFILVNLFQNQVLTDSQSGFSATEPIIEMALDPVQLASEEMVGLIGELWTLRALLFHSDKNPKNVIECWLGWDRSSRDFQFSNFGIEVKTTRGQSSIHSIQNLRQIEPGVGDFKFSETYLYLVSIGVDPVDGDCEDGGCFSLPELVDAIIEIIQKSLNNSEHELIGTLLSKIQLYGISNSRNYDHLTMRNRDFYTRKFRIAFARSYDLLDPHLKIIRSSQMTDFHHVKLDSISFQISLPNRVSGDENPIQELDSFVKLWSNLVP